MMNTTSRSRVVVITGSTRGIGFGLAREFLKRGCHVVVSGRGENGVNAAITALQASPGTAVGKACDVTSPSDVQALWAFAVEHFKYVDIWINNAGVVHPQATLFELPPEEMRKVVHTNIAGTLYGIRTAASGMLSQGGGAIYNMEGLGSDGRRVRGMGVYGSSKYCLSYLTDTLAAELKGTPVIAGAIQPGMVLTDMLVGEQRQSEQSWEESSRIFNILADRVETVTPWIADRVLANTRHGARIRWLTTIRAAWRFLSYPFTKRDLISEMVRD